MRWIKKWTEKSSKEQHSFIFMQHPLPQAISSVLAKRKTDYVRLMEAEKVMKTRENTASSYLSLYAASIFLSFLLYSGCELSRSCCNCFLSWASLSWYILWVKTVCKCACSGHLSVASLALEDNKTIKVRPQKHFIEVFLQFFNSTRHHQSTLLLFLL